MPRGKGLAEKSLKFFQVVEVSQEKIEVLMKGKKLVRKMLRFYQEGKSLTKNK